MNMNRKPKPKSERYRGLRDFLGELRRSRSGLIGLIMIFAFIIISVYSTAEFPYSKAQEWNDRRYWTNNPTSVPPAWIQYVTNRALPETMFYRAPNSTKTRVRYNGTTSIVIGIDQSLSFRYTFDDTPTNVIISMNVQFSKSAPKITITWVKPPENAGAHATSIELAKFNMALGAGQPPYYNVSEDLYPVADKEIKGKLAYFLQTSFNRTIDPDNIDTLEVLFGTNKSLSGTAPFQILKGTYHLRISYESYNSALDFPSGKPLIDDIKSLQLVLGGRVYGLMGTDSWGRDLFAGILWGAPAALVIGLLTSVVSVAIGVFLGVLSGFYGGRVDDVVQRITDYFLILPFLPLLIFLSFILRPSIWNLIWLLSVFGWPGITKVVRSIALQIRESGYVEAARALGASRMRILLRHVLPQTLPYTFANVALSVPGAIFAEASISFLGLGDPVIPTWGKILGDAQAAGAVIGGYWWWVLIPGLCIILVAMSFALLGNALDRILTPKLRRR
jgi:peptide/nickel transport system permease protein